MNVYVWIRVLMFALCFSSSRTFTHNMVAFGLSKKLCNDFLKKQAVIGNLNEGISWFLIYITWQESHLFVHRFHSPILFFWFRAIQAAVRPHRADGCRINVKGRNHPNLTVHIISIPQLRMISIPHSFTSYKPLQKLMQCPAAMWKQLIYSNSYKNMHIYWNSNISYDIITINFSFIKIWVL